MKRVAVRTCIQLFNVFQHNDVARQLAKKCVFTTLFACRIDEGMQSVI